MSAETVPTFDSGSFLQAAPYVQPDAIFTLTAEYNCDSDIRRVNLGQGTYKDENGKPWVLSSVLRARQVLENKGLNHEYLPILGHAVFRNLVSQLILGSRAYKLLDDKLAVCQALSGTGALHLAGLLLKSIRHPIPSIYIPEPTWSNHHQIFQTLGFETSLLPYYNYDTKDIDFEKYTSALSAAEEYSVVVLHACAHNPTGCDPSDNQWRIIGRIIKEKKLFPLFDAAYLGFKSGDFDSDAFSIRHSIDELRLEVAVCASFAKNMGLYSERVGCLIFVAKTAKTARNIQSVLEMQQRSELSNPPAYGAKIAATVLGDEELRQMWYKDLTVMSSRIQSMRVALYLHLTNLEAPGSWDHLIRQAGMFAFLGLPAKIVYQLKEKHHIYMADNSRISIAGLHEGNVEYVAQSIAERLQSQYM